MVHVSRKPVLVPVFTAAGKGTSNGVTPPNPGMRAFGSLRMSLMTYACSALSTRVTAAGGEREAVALDAIECGEPEAMADLEHRVEANGVERAHRGHVERRRERDAQRHDGVEGPIEVLRRVRPLVGREG